MALLQRAKALYISRLGMTSLRLLYSLAMELSMRFVDGCIYQGDQHMPL